MGVLVEMRKLFGVGRILPSPDWRLPVQVHPFSELIVVVEGRMRVWDAQDVLVEAEAGQLLHYPAGVAHREQSDGLRPVGTFYLSFEGTKGQGIQRFEDTRGRLRWLAQALFEDYERGELSEAQRQAYLQFFNAELGRQREATRAQQLVCRARDYLRAHLHEAIQLEQVAHACGLSPYHFSRTYKRESGISPMADLKRLRLARVRDLLRCTDFPLKLIAEQCGFANEFHLSREFRRHEGRTTTDYRLSVS